MYKQIKTLKTLIENGLTETFASALTAVNFDLLSDKLLRNEFDQEDETIDKLELLKDFIDILQFIEEDSEFESVLDDETYDKLAEQYRNITGNAVIGSSLVSSSSKRLMRKHLYPELVGTLDKLHFIHEKDIPDKDSRKSLEKWLSSAISKCEAEGVNLFKDGLNLSVVYKYDGLSAVIECNGKMALNAVTRRDTEAGEGLDISHIFKYKEVPTFIEGLPSDIFNDCKYGVKVEIMVTDSQYEELCKMSDQIPKHRRSAATKIVNTDESGYNPEWFNCITTPALQISVDRELNLSEEESKQWLYCGIVGNHHMYINLYNKFDTTDKSISINNTQGIDMILDQVFDGLVNTFKTTSNGYGIPIDGIVLTINNPDAIRILGRKDSINKFQAAYKFPAGEAKTILKGIDFQVGPIAGNVTPVAIVEPVKIAGTTITHATLSNFVKLERMNLHLGDEVIIKYDIIPKIMKDDTCKCSDSPQIMGLTNCPLCQSVLNLNNDIPRCVNPNCESKLVGKINNYLAKIGVLGIGIETISTLFEKGFIHSIPDLYHLQEYEKDIVQLDGFGVTSYNNIIKAINSRLVLYPHEILGSLGIPDIGRRIMKKICKEMTMEEILSDNPDMIDKMIAIEGIGKKTALKICEGINSNREIINHLMRYLGIKPYEDEVDPDQVVYFTGVRDAEFANLLKDKYNFAIADSFDKKTTMLIYGKPSKKVDKAKEMGINILSYNEAREKYK